MVTVCRGRMLIAIAMGSIATVLWNLSVPIGSSVMGMDPADRLLQNTNSVDNQVISSESLFRHLISIKTMLDGMNSILGYTENSSDLQILEGMGTSYGSLEPRKEERALYKLLHDTRITAESIQKSVDAVKSMMTMLIANDARDNSDTKQYPDEIIKEMFEELMNVTLPASMNKIVSMRDNDYKIQLLRVTEISQLHSIQTTNLLDALTNDYGKEFVSGDLLSTLPELRKALLDIKYSLRDAKAWLRIQERELRNLSDSICPLDPIYHVRSYGNVLCWSKHHLASILSLYRVHRELDNYKSFLRHASGITESISRGLDVAELEPRILKVYRIGTLVIQHIMSNHIWTDRKRQTVELQISRMKIPVLEFIDHLKNDIYDVNGDWLVNQKVDFYRPILAKSKYRLFYNHLDDAKHLLCEMFGRLREETRRDNAASLAYDDPLREHTEAFEALLASVRSINGQCWTRENSVHQYSIQLLDLQEGAGELARIRMDSYNKELKRELKRHDAPYTALLEIILDMNKQLYIMGINPPVVESNYGLAFVKSVMTNMSFIAARSLEESTFGYFDVVKAVESVTIRLSADRLSSPSFLRSRCLRQIDAEYGHVLSRWNDLKTICDTFEITEAGRTHLHRFHERIVNFTGSFDSPVWTRTIKDFLATKAQMHRMMMLALSLPRMARMVEELENAVNTIGDRLPELVDRIQNCQTLSRHIADVEDE
ncbi:uncharacterized protein BXIN_1145 [Babesia sp. Xinjiang]|uniref:uncharacterized protein n=1 Tax=Babesia sp. Xinjiang TaxID=462227 RepID=UPI000A252CF1|nr:uncharacterized protein BXIN_1145 [Babesia sp. Xinjiang]ORM40099.1 hypothetical protein BXIN_1145 [Babesia sp. Xinjiang]